MERTIPQQHSARQPTPLTAIEPLDISFGGEFEFILIEHFSDQEGWESRELKDEVFYGPSQVGDVLKAALFKFTSCGDYFHMPIGVQPADQSWRPDHGGRNVLADDSMQLTERQKAPLKESHYNMLGVCSASAFGSTSICRDAPLWWPLTSSQTSLQSKRKPLGLPLSLK